MDVTKAMKKVKRLDGTSCMMNDNLKMFEVVKRLVQSGHMSTPQYDQQVADILFDHVLVCFPMLAYN